jgi:hypothetical protein
LRRTRARVLHGALAVGLGLAACTSSSGEDASEWPSLRDAADAFFEAWSDGDHAAMADALYDPSAARWDEADLARLMRRQTRAGAITSFEAAAGEVEQPDDAAFVAATDEDDPEELSSFVPYRVTYGSDAVESAAELSGDLTFYFDAEEEAWRAAFEDDVLWPGLDGADGFKITTRWPKRGAILDRSGKRLAVGPAGERRYPFGSVGGSTVGHIETVTKRTLEEHPGAEVGDLVGGSGLEEGLNDRLAGEPEAQLAVVDAAGESIEVVGGRDAVAGHNVKVALDIDVQRAAEAAYGDTVGGAAVIDPSTGDILAAVASGPFDPNGYVGATEVNPFNRALVGLYPPGSSMKVLTASAALEEGVVTPSSMVTGPQEYKGVRNFESGEFGSISFASATQNSVNTAYAQVAEKLGARRLTRYAESFGFNRMPEMPLEAAEPSFPFPEGLGDLMWASIGQAQVVATPLQMATIAGTVANDGVRMEPRIVRSDPKTPERVVSNKTARQMTALMRSVVIGGTGTAANITGLDVAGKTGTAEVDVDGQRKNHAWFIAFAPAGNPEVAVAVVSEYGGVGGQVAAPIAGRMLQAVTPHIR